MAIFNLTHSTQIRPLLVGGSSWIRGKEIWKGGRGGRQDDRGLSAVESRTRPRSGHYHERRNKWAKESKYRTLVSWLMGRRAKLGYWQRYTWTGRPNECGGWWRARYSQINGRQPNQGFRARARQVVALRYLWDCCLREGDSEHQSSRPPDRDTEDG